MAIYDADGVQLFNAYDADGNELNYAYDADGNVIFQKEAPTGTPLKAMEYNVGQWYVGNGTNPTAGLDARYYELHNGMIQSANADVLIMCEYLDNMSQLPRTAESMLSQYYPYILTQGGGSGYYGRAICSKYPLSNWTHHAYTNESARYYDSAEMTVDGKQITLVVTHLATDSKRYDQITELIQYLSTLDRFICAGDFNPLTFNATHVGIDVETTQDYTDIAVPLMNAGFKLANWSDLGFKYTYSDATDADYDSAWKGCLDNIVTSSNGTVESVMVDTTKLTDSITVKVDHMPLIAELTVY